MNESVSALLAQRAATPLEAPFRYALVAAITLHLGVGLGAWLLPSWLAPPKPPIEYVAVTIVPAAKLGVEQPKPAPPAKVEAAEPAPAPKPAVAPEAPVLPAPKAKKSEPKPAARPAPPQTSPAAPTAVAEEQGVADGALAGMALGAPVARLDNPDFTYGYYVDQMLAMISRNWVRPPVGGGIEAWLHYRIERDGRIVALEIVRSSGINSFDLAALRAVQSASPLPPLPRAFRDDSLGVNLIVR